MPSRAAIPLVFGENASAILLPIYAPEIPGGGLEMPVIPVDEFHPMFRRQIPPGRPHHIEILLPARQKRGGETVQSQFGAPFRHAVQPQVATTVTTFPAPGDGPSRANGRQIALEAIRFVNFLKKGISFEINFQRLYPSAELQQWMDIGIMEKDPGDAPGAGVPERLSGAQEAGSAARVQADARGWGRRDRFHRHNENASGWAGKSRFFLKNRRYFLFFPKGRENRTTGIS